MRKVNFIISLIFVASVVIGQDKMNIEVPYTDDAPAIDGIEDLTWDQVPAVSLDKVVKGTTPTVTAYWKALWNDDALYVLVSVEDDDHWPSWKSGGSWFEYDQVEVYLDVNTILEDGKGPGEIGTGHYQVQPGFADGGSGIPGSLPAVPGQRPEGTYCYVLSGADYVFEYALTYTSFINKDGIALDVGAFYDLEKIGFDVYVIDQDEGVTTSKQRAAWHNTGVVNTNYSNMDDAGTITLADIESSVDDKSISISVYPNPVVDYLVINADYDKLVITDVLGKAYATIVDSDNKINMEFLPQGIYFIQAYNKGISIGVTKIYKK
jgi:hypothetical protein